MPGGIDHREENDHLLTAVDDPADTCAHAIAFHRIFFGLLPIKSRERGTFLFREEPVQISV